MFAAERGSAAEHKRLLPGPSDPGQTEIAAQFLSYPAQESGGGMFVFILRRGLYSSNGYTRDSMKDVRLGLGK